MCLHSESAARSRAKASSSSSWCHPRRQIARRREAAHSSRSHGRALADPVPSDRHSGRRSRCWSQGNCCKLQSSTIARCDTAKSRDHRKAFSCCNPFDAIWRRILVLLMAVVKQSRARQCIHVASQRVGRRLAFHERREQVAPVARGTARTRAPVRARPRRPLETSNRAPNWPNGFCDASYLPRSSAPHSEPAPNWCRAAPSRGLFASVRLSR